MVHQTATAPPTRIAATQLCSAARQRARPRSGRGDWRRARELLRSACGTRGAAQPGAGAACVDRNAMAAAGLEQLRQVIERGACHRRCCIRWAPSGAHGRRAQPVACPLPPIRTASLARPTPVV